MIACGNTQSTHRRAMTTQMPATVTLLLVFRIVRILYRNGLSVAEVSARLLLRTR